MKIYSLDTVRALDSVYRCGVNVCVVGAGTVGLPLATFLANKGFRVSCYDRSEERVRRINDGQVLFEYHNELKSAIENGRISATTDPSVVKDNDIIFVCVPTPLTKDNAMDNSMLLDVAEKIGGHLSPGHLVIFESSVAIGTTGQIREKLEEISGLRCSVDFGIAYCPERYNPGLPKEIHPEVKYDDSRLREHHRVDTISRVIGAADPKSLAIAKAIYSMIIKAPIKTVSSIEAAEATKLLENIFRDVNIALVNELAKVYSKFGLDIYEIIDAAKTKPFAFLPHYPGAGVGGECIPVDTHYLIKQAEQMGMEPLLMKSARLVNDSMPYYTIELLESGLKQAGKKLEGSRICILGASYKKNIDDTRLSPSFVIAHELEERGALVRLCDPLVNPSKLKNFLSVPVDRIFEGTDAVVLVTDHDEFQSLDFSGRSRMVVVDGRNFFVKDAIEKLGHIYLCVGKHFPG
jgi:nucleotide sugar dehydrogenase